MTERLGIFGGAFDPVHIGHYEAINFISGLEIIDEIQDKWFGFRMPIPREGQLPEGAL